MPFNKSFDGLMISVSAEIVMLVLVATSYVAMSAPVSEPLCSSITPLPRWIASLKTKARVLFAATPLSASAGKKFARVGASLSLGCTPNCDSCDECRIA